MKWNNLQQKAEEAGLGLYTGTGQGNTEFNFSGIEQLEIRKGIIQNQNLETKHVKDKILS